MVWKEFSARYRGSFFGLLWAILNPLLTVLVFAFVFGTLFQARWGDRTASSFDFVCIALAGLLAHGILAETIGRAPGLILAHVSFVKKVIFPLEILPVTTVVGAAINGLIGLAVVLVVYAVAHGGAAPTALFVPLILLPYLVLVLGIALFFSATGVFLRDLGQVAGSLTMLTLFLAPIFYPIEMVPPAYRPLLYLNPLTFTVEQMRAVAFFGRFPDWTGLLIYLGAACGFCWLGLAWFQKTRKAFADVI